MKAVPYSKNVRFSLPIDGKHGLVRSVLPIRIWLGNCSCQKQTGNFDNIGEIF
jgi:hypothetical protein